MLAVIPYFALRVYRPEILGTELPLDPWAILVCIGFVVGLEVARARAIRFGLDVRDIVDGAVFTVVMGFVVAHVVTVVGYFPERMKIPECTAGDTAACWEGVMSILRVWDGFSSTGGFIGAVLGAWLFYNVIRKRPALRHADIITYGFPFGWFFGRLGCASVHDHIGRETTFPLAMDFDWGLQDFYWYNGDPAPWVSGVRHELGMYEAAYMIPVMAIFWWLGRVDRPPGFFLAWFAILYAPVRFVLDFLRNVDLDHQDARYFAFSPIPLTVIVLVASLALLFRGDQIER
ncbi:MAG: prolipoprotein diacylglyceryl transferase, partial [Myxococcales bacterium]|nr:prolipoprotein diacylglyceryl transferase [Myxococcales bacterium]